MTEFKLVSGRFNLIDAEMLIKELVKVKINFHEEQIRSVKETEEDIKHSEKRIKELEDVLRLAIKAIKSNNAKVDLRVDVKIESVM